ncbi:MAG TPA: hypothetical protein VFV90_12065, partial [Usitatibacter sp.]|nr:hypothetical protein [Usitatibacter sp.]
MTPDEEALLRARLGPAGSELLMPGIQNADAFRRKLAGGSGLALGLAESLPGVGTAVRAGEGLAAGSALIPQTARERAEQVVTGTKPGDPLALSRKAQEELGPEQVASRGGLLTRPAPMDTPLADVSPAPQLNPGLTQVGRPMGGGGASGGDGLLDRFRYAQKQQLDEMGVQRELTGDLGAAQAERTEKVAGLQEQQAGQMRSDADEEKRINEDAHARVMKVVDRTEQLANEIRSAKVDSGRFMRNKDTGTKVLMHIGAIASGMLRGLQGGPNEFMNRLDGYIEQDIREQQAEIDNKKAALHANQSMVGQLLQVTGDRRVAADVARRLMYESAKTDLAAKDARYRIPEAKAGVDLAMNAIDQKIATINAEGAKNAYEVALKQAQAAAAARAAEAKRAEEQRRWDLEFGLKKEHSDIERQKAFGTTGEDFNKQTQALGKDLADKDLAEGRETTEAVKRRLMTADPKTGEMRLDPNKGLPGVGRVADARARLKPEGINVLNPVMQGVNAVAGLSDEERVS